MRMQTSIQLILVVAFCAFLGATGQVFFKLGSESLSLSMFSLLSNWRIMLGLFLYGIATLIFLGSLKFGRLSILYPIIATSYIWVTIFSTLLLKEPFAPYKWFGILMIIGGISVIVK